MRVRICMARRELLRGDKCALGPTTDDAVADGFCQVVADAAFAGFVDAHLFGVRTDDDERDAGGGGVLVKLLQNRLTGHVGDIEIEQDHVRLAGAGDLDALFCSGVECD